jgi:hypothetical protein
MPRAPRGQWLAQANVHFAENERGQSERQKDQHECKANSHHFHPVSERIGVLKQKDREKYNEGDLHPAGKEHAQAKPPVPH